MENEGLRGFGDEDLHAVGDVDLQCDGDGYAHQQYGDAPHGDARQEYDGHHRARDDYYRDVCNKYGVDAQYAYGSHGDGSYDAHQGCDGDHYQHGVELNDDHHYGGLESYGGRCLHELAEPNVE